MLPETIFFSFIIKKPSEDCPGFLVAVAIILRVCEQSPITSNCFSFGARIEPTGAQKCPPLATPLTFGGFQSRSRSNDFFGGSGSEAGSTKMRVRGEGGNYDSASL